MNFYLRKQDIKEINQELFQFPQGQPLSKDLKGPFSKAQIFQLLFSDIIDKKSLLFRGEQSSLSIEEEFKFFFDEKECWVLLKKIKNTFKKSSGYSTKGLQSLLKKGWVSDKDFVWKNGFKSWERISVRSEFHTPLESSVEDFLDRYFLGEKKTFSPVSVYQRPAPSLFDLRWKK